MFSSSAPREVHLSGCAMGLVEGVGGVQCAAAGV
jgi:hypothetical protein